MVEKVALAGKMVTLFMESLSGIIPYVEKIRIETLSTIEKLNSLKGTNVDELKRKLHSSKTLLLKMLICAKRYVADVEKCLNYADLDKSKLADMKQTYKEKNYTSITTYIKQIRQYFEDSTKSYKEFSSICKKAKTQYEDAAKECSAKKTEAANSESKIVGVGAAATGVGVGVLGTAAILAGIFTAGIATPMVLGVGAGVFGAVSTVTTYKLASIFGEVRKELDDTLKNFDSLSEIASACDVHMHAIVQEFGSIEKDRNTADKHVTNEEEYLSFCRDLDILMGEIKKTREAMGQDKFRIDEEIKKLE